MARKQSGQKARRTMQGRRLGPARVGKRPIKVIVEDRKQQTAAEHRRMGGR
jgi:hypothetical protein